MSPSRASMAERLLRERPSYPAVRRGELVERADHFHAFFAGCRLLPERTAYPISLRAAFRELVNEARDRDDRESRPECYHRKTRYPVVENLVIEDRPPASPACPPQRYREWCPVCELL